MDVPIFDVGWTLDRGVHFLGVCVRAYVCVCVCVRVRACVRACVCMGSCGNFCSLPLLHNSKVYVCRCLGIAPW